jgi:hypothetical protein
MIANSGACGTPAASFAERLRSEQVVMSIGSASMSVASTGGVDVRPTAKGRPTAALQSVPSAYAFRDSDSAGRRAAARPNL